MQPVPVAVQASSSVSLAGESQASLPAVRSYADGAGNLTGGGITSSP
jgi:hypothetical protein